MKSRLRKKRDSPTSKLVFEMCHFGIGVNHRISRFMNSG